MLQISISETNWTAALGTLPSALRVSFLERLLGVGAPDSAGSMPAAVDHRSHALTVEQATELLSKTDSVMIEVIKAAVSNVAEGVATIDWLRVKKITGGLAYGPFGRGALSGLHRSLRSIVGDRKAVLLWTRAGWKSDGQGDWAQGEFLIDGPAVAALRIALGIAF